MAFRDFKYPDVLTALGLTSEPVPDLFGDAPESPPSPGFPETFSVGNRLANILNNEKARSEWMIAPLLGEFWWRYRGRIGLFSGAEFDADPAAGLNGCCDFILSRVPQQPYVTPPVAVIVEAKRENVIDGLGQCIAGMVGAQRFNRRNNTPGDVIYGAVTTGSVWKFLRLSGTTVELDLIEYQSLQIGKLLGILAQIIGPVPQPAAA